MRKLLALAVMLGGMVALTGCELIDEDWENFTFPSLSGKANLEVLLHFDGGSAASITTSGYTSDNIAVAVYKTNCSECQAQAPYFEQLANKFRSQNKNMDFVIIFLDIYDGNSTVSWIKNLTQVEAYANMKTECAGGACQKVFTNYLGIPSAGRVYYINKKDIEKVQEGMHWNTVANQEQLYQLLEKEATAFLSGEGNLNLDWNNASSNTVEL